MSVAIDEVSSEVTVESPLADSDRGAAGVEAELDRLRAARAALARDDRRTRAEGFDD